MNPTVPRIRIKLVSPGKTSLLGLFSQGLFSQQRLLFLLNPLPCLAMATSLQRDLTVSGGNNKKTFSRDLAQARQAVGSP